MTKRNTLFATACAITLLATSPALSEPQSTKILEEFFDISKNVPITLEVGDKDEGARYTQWNNITLNFGDGAAQIAIPWVRVSKKILGGHELLVAEQIDGVIQPPESKALAPINIVIETQNLVAEISGEEGARRYNSSFDEMIIRAFDNDIFNMTAKFIDVTETIRMEKGDMGRTSGDFSVQEVVLDYAAKVDGQSISSNSTMQNLVGNYEIPTYSDFDPENPTAFFDASRNLVIAYGVDSSDTKVAMMSPMGPIEVTATFGAANATLGVVDSTATIIAESNDIKYEMLAEAAGFPPMQVSISDLVMNIGIPLDNVDESKQTNYKIALNGLAISDAIWMMFDPKALLPRDEISLDIDLLASMRWMKKIAEFDVNHPEKAPPVEVENAEIRALNLKIAGAELQTSGSVMIDNSQFPPIPDGTVNISLDGGFGLLGKLTELGLVPEQKAAMIQGMSAMFFKPGDGGDDSLVSTITMTKDGHISANGMPLK